MGSSQRIVLHIFGQMNRGGAERRTLDIMHAIDRSRFELSFCTLTGLPGTLDDEIRSLGGKVYPCRLGPRFLLSFRTLLRTLRPHVVHSHVHHFSGLMLMLAHAEQVPVRVAHFRTTGDGHAPGPDRSVQRWVMKRLVDKYATHILAVSQGTMDQAWGERASCDPRCQVIYNGIRIDAFAKHVDREQVRMRLSIPPFAHLVIHIGRMEPEKNHPRVVEIFHEVARRDSDSHLLLIGRGSHDVRSSLQEQIARLGLTRRVHMVGEIDHARIPEVLRASDVLLFPSIREGLPGVVLEACACGLPVVASDLPGVVEIAARLPGVWSLPLTEPDGVWADAVTKLLGSATLPTAALDRFAASDFTLECCVAAHVAVWNSSGSPR